MYKLILLIQLTLLVLLSSELIGQEQTIQTLKRQLNTQLHDTTICTTYLEIANLYSRQNNDSATFYLDLAEQHINKKLSDKEWGRFRLVDIVRNRGNIHFFNSNYHDALNYYFAAAKGYEELITAEGFEDKSKLNRALARLYVNIGVSYSTIGDFTSSMEYYYKALNIYERNGNLEGMASCYLGIGNLEYYSLNIENAITSINKSADLYLRVNSKSGLANCKNTLGGIYFNKKAYNESLRYFNEARLLKEEIGDKKGTSTAYTNMANVYLETQNYNLAISYFNKSLKLDEELRDLYGATIVRVNIARLYDRMATTPNMPAHERQRYFNMAVDYGLRAYKDAEEMKVLPVVNFVADLLSKQYRSLGEYEQSDRFTAIFNSTKDSIQNSETTKALAEMQTRYETDKKQQEINYLNEQKEKQKFVTLTILLGFIILLVTSLFLYRLLLLKKRANILLANQQEQIVLHNTNLQQANEEILAQRDEIMAQRDLVLSQKELIERAHLSITDSLRYARSIQAAILPSKKVLQQVSKDSFVLMKPCELVSGDFFWVTVFDEYQIFCVADCTGHGVPGAFMSILGINALNDVVARYRITTPSEILGHLRSRVIEALSQNDPDQLHKDGMEIGLCTLNTRTKELQFAGAVIPLWIIAEEKSQLIIPSVVQPISANGFSLFEVKGDNMPVGMSPVTKQFTNHKICLFDNTISLYLASDGFADQLNQLGKAKFGTSRLKNLILSNHSETMANQEKVLVSELDRWMGNSYQIDDITVLGVKMNCTI